MEPRCRLTADQREDMTKRYDAFVDHYSMEARAQGQLRIGVSIAQRRNCRLQQLIDQINDRRQAQGVLFDSQIASHLDHFDAMPIHSPWVDTAPNASSARIYITSI